jgi:hypothetical protein
MKYIALYGVIPAYRALKAGRDFTANFVPAQGGSASCFNYMILYGVVVSLFLGMTG